MVLATVSVAVDLDISIPHSGRAE